MYRLIVPPGAASQIPRHSSRCQASFAATIYFCGSTSTTTPKALTSTSFRALNFSANISQCDRTVACMHTKRRTAAIQLSLKMIVFEMAFDC